jgi:ATP-dependent DNA helicase RecG
VTERDRPDWLRLQKALSVEAERGFTDLQGNQYRFSEFLCLTLGQSPPPGSPAHLRHRWQELAVKFSDYSQQNLEERQSLVATTRRFLHELRQNLETPNAPKTVVREVENKPPAPLPISNKAIALEQLLKEVEDIGTYRAKTLAYLNLQTVRDLLFYFPRDYIDYAQQKSIIELKAGDTVTLIGRVVKFNIFNSPKNPKLAIFEMIIRDQTGRIKLSRFLAGNRFTNKGWQEGQKKRYPPGTAIAASGLVKENKYGLTLDNPSIEILEDPNSPVESLNIGRVLPVYPLTEGVPIDLLRKCVVTALGAVSQLEDALPLAIQKQYDLIDLQTAIAQIHFPDDNDSLTLARRRLVFDEFFYLQLGFLQRRYIQKATEKSVVFTPSGELIEKFNQLLPFKLTNAQQRVVHEILEDLKNSTPMNRLVQGDVGSGKTVVGVFAVLAALQSGYQAAFMAPTEVLAEQHYRKLVQWFNLLYLPVELLTGSTKVKKRREIHSQLETGELPLLVGTHALIQDKVNFNRLGLVVIDEQHRFGVQQRAKLLAKGEAPHVLTMTATPIPRTMALTLHGDLDVSQIDELPPGRQPIQTTVLTPKERQQIYDLIRREVAQGRQVYIIFPTIEQSEKLDLKAAVDEHQYLSETVFPNFQIGLLHGRMSSVDKDTVLNSFRDNQTQIIVSTTVIEVGVDVPNATVMLIENAERFGLSQLHQLRGRVGRGEHSSYCLLMTNSKNPDARQRLSVLEQSQDGFFISEMDLRLRGPGEVLGTRQSGLPDFALASLVEDQEILLLAREAAENMIKTDASLANFPILQRELQRRYEKMIGAEMLT